MTINLAKWRELAELNNWFQPELDLNINASTEASVIAASSRSGLQYDIEFRQVCGGYMWSKALNGGTDTRSFSELILDK
jgi:hypothetical protein